VQGERPINNLVSFFLGSGEPSMNIPRVNAGSSAEIDWSESASLRASIKYDLDQRPKQPSVSDNMPSDQDMVSGSSSDGTIEEKTRLSFEPKANQKQVKISRLRTFTNGKADFLLPPKNPAGSKAFVKSDRS
jgi:hypothetical protein